MRGVTARPRSSARKVTSGLGCVALTAALAFVGCAGTTEPVTYGVTEAGSQLEFGVKMAQRGLWDEALFRFQQAQRIDSSSATGYNNVAVAQEALGLYDDALASYQKGLRLEPSNPDLKRNYARFVEFYQNFKPDKKDEKDEEDIDRGEPGSAAALTTESVEDTGDQSSNL